MIQALIFDCDGTLTDSMFAHFAAWRDALALQGMELCEQSFYRHSGVPSSRVIPMLAAEQDVVVDFESALHAHAKSEASALIDKINSTGDYDDDIAAELKTLVEGFKATGAY